ncbi:MAG: hypothetical protein ACTTKH_05385 [Treponema sp.]
MPTQQKKPILIFFFILSFSFLNALSFGFEITSENIFLKKNNNHYYPDIVSSFDISLFLSHSFILKNLSLFIETGFFIDSTYNIEKKELGRISSFPFFRRLNFSAFTEYFSFTFAKDTISFGEGFFNINNYFSLNHLYKKMSPLYHVLLEIPISQFSFSLGGAMDSKAIDHFEPIEWYQTWGYTSYSNNIVSIGFESDVLFTVSSKKDAVLKIASEVLFSLPLDFKIYASGKVPISLYNKTVTMWGAFVGGAKSFILEEYNFTSILGLSCSSEGVEYSIFQNIGINEIMNFTFGLQGSNKNAIHFVFENTFFVSALKFRLSYITKNLIKAEDMQGVFSIGVSLND